MARERKKSFLLYESQRGLVELLGEAERAALLTAIYDYVASGSYSPLPTLAADVAFTAIRTQLDIDADRYREICELRRGAANARWEKGQNAAKPHPKSQGEGEGSKMGQRSGVDRCKCTYTDTDTDTDTDADTDTDTDIVADAVAAARSKRRGSFETDAFFEAALRRSYEGGEKNDKKNAPTDLEA